MEITRSIDVEFEERTGGRATAPGTRTRIKRLHEAPPTDAPGFEMVVARYPAARDYPEHRHSVDQVRLTLVGRSPWSLDHATPEGSLVYIPAGTPYGPYTRPAGVELMAVQFQGLPDYPFAGEAGSQVGPFPPARTPVAIELDPAAVAWTPIAPGVEQRHLLTFGADGVRLAWLRIGRDADWSLAVAQRTLAFVVSGAGDVADGPLSAGDAIRLEPGEALGLTGRPSVELFVLTLPRIDAARPA